MDLDFSFYSSYTTYLDNHGLHCDEFSELSALLEPQPLDNLENLEIQDWPLKPENSAFHQPEAHCKILSILFFKF